MRTLVVIALAAFLSAGCSDPGQMAADDPNRSTAPPEDETGLRQNGTYDETITLVETPVSGDHINGECVVFFEEDIQKVIRGNVSVSWTAQDPTAKELRLVLSTGLGATPVEVSGPTPLRLALPAFEVTDQFYFALKPPMEDAGVLIQLPIAMEWSFLYDGDADVRVAHGGC